VTTLPQIRVPHLRDGFIVAKVGIARKRDRWSRAISLMPRMSRCISFCHSLWESASALAPEIGPGFSPDIPGTTTKGFSP
jgi:hypothetical protein